MSHKRWDELVGSLRQTLGALPDRRTGDNTIIRWRTSA
jgi:hypothetical protein